jgi:hypothetical protein
MFTQLAALRRQQRRITEFPMGGWLEEKAAPIVERAVQSQLTRALGQVDGP